MGSRVIYILVAYIAALAAVHAATQGFILRDGFPVLLSTDLTSLDAVDYDCSARYDALMVSTTTRVIFFNSKGEELGSYSFSAPVHSLTALKTGTTSCSGVAGVWNGKAYAFFMPEGERRIDSYGKKWEFYVGERIYTMTVADFNGDGYEDMLLIGTGSYTDKSFGNLYALPVQSYPGNYTWKYATTGRVKSIAVLDLMGDMLRDDVAVAYGRRVDVLDFNASLVWSYEAKAAVNALAPADFDGDGAVDDLIIGAGNEVIALDSHRQEVWRLDLEEEVVAVVPVDRDGDGVIDYHLVAAGKKIYAVRDGSPSWEFDTGVEINALTLADFDDDGIREDVALISDNKLFAYDYALLYLPELTINKSASFTNGSVNITLVLKNIGDGIARGIKLLDPIPEGWKVLAGGNSWRGDLVPGKRVAISYLLKPSSPGNYTLPEAEVRYYDKYGRSYAANSSRVQLNIPEKKTEPQEKSKKSAEKKAPPPVLMVDRTADGNLTKGGNVTINVLLRNIGGSTAFISFEMDVPDGVELNKSRWEGEVKKDEVKVISFLLLERNLTSDIKEIALPAMNIIYRDESGATYTATTGELVIPVDIREKGLLNRLRGKIKFLPLLLLPLLLIFILHRKGKINIRISLPRKLKIPGKIPLKIPRRGAPSITSEELEKLEKAFVKAYLEYQKRGERPTYGEMMERLGVDLETVKEIVDRIKRSGKYTLQ